LNGKKISGGHERGTKKEGQGGKVGRTSWGGEKNHPSIAKNHAKKDNKEKNRVALPEGRRHLRAVKKKGTGGGKDQRGEQTAP